ncbi:MAG: hypothetical protein CVU66_00920 [Deltaproteobacteria bacterium HGW-Deltaproteobacteria-23]|nr:MAG: hypothetical protein CVU66_00920 [Deltaproteobacteria bacterium HGW-Deltaproteobacteria-23]
MRKFIHLKLISTVLLLVMLAVTIQGAHESAHALQTPAHAASSAEEAPASHDTPCTPFEHHQDYDGCDSCVNCPCHASFTIQPLQLSYNPVISDLHTFDPFKYLPEVYLSKFVPPQI